MTCRVRAAFEGLDARDLVASFNWLSAVFAAPPDSDFVASYRRGPAAAWLESVASLPGCAQAVERIRCALEADPADALVAARVGSAYGILFEGIGGPRTVSPYEVAACRWRTPVRRAGRRDGSDFRRPRLVGDRFGSRGARPHRRRTRCSCAVAGGRRTRCRSNHRAATRLASRFSWLTAPLWTPSGFWAGTAAVVIAIVGLATRQPATAEILDATRH